MPSGYDENWVNEVDEYKCFICKLVAKNVLKHDCGKFFCEACDQVWRCNHKSCAFCHEESEASEDHYTRFRIDNILIKCRVSCNTTFPLCKKSSHYEECPSLRFTENSSGKRNRPSQNVSVNCEDCCSCGLDQSVLRQKSVDCYLDIMQHQQQVNEILSDYRKDVANFRELIGSTDDESSGESVSISNDCRSNVADQASSDDVTINDLADSISDTINNLTEEYGQAPRHLFSAFAKWHESQQGLVSELTKELLNKDFSE